MKYGQSVPQKTAHNMSTKDNPCTLPINLYAQVQPTITPLGYSKIAEDRQEGARTTAYYDNSHELLYTSRDVVFLASDAYTLPCTSPALVRVHGPSLSYLFRKPVQSNTNQFYKKKKGRVIMESQNCLMILIVIILGGYVIILGGYVIILGAYVFILGAYSIIFGAYSIIFGAYSIIFGA